MSSTTSPESSIASNVSLSRLNCYCFIMKRLVMLTNQSTYKEEEHKKIKQTDHNHTSDNSENGVDNHNSVCTQYQVPISFYSRVIHGFIFFSTYPAKF